MRNRAGSNPVIRTNKNKGGILMSNVILGTFYNENGEIHPETLIVNFFNNTLRISLELGTRTSFAVPFKPIVELIKSAHSSEEIPFEKQLKLNGKYSNLQNNIDITDSEILVNYRLQDDHKIIGFSAPKCGKIETQLERLIPYMDKSLQHILENI